MVLLRVLIQVPLDNAKLGRVLGVLHDVPVERLLVLAVNARGLDELGLELVDGVLRVSVACPHWWESGR